MTTFVLVHGAWHGSWCWEQVRPDLERRGHIVLAPDLPGMGEDKTPLKDVTLAMWADFVCDLVKRAGTPVVLVGHSRGGIVISEVAQRVPQLVSKLVYLAAFLVPNGKTLSDMLALGEAREVAKNAIEMRPDGISSMVAADRIGAIFYNTTSSALQTRAALLLSPEPMMSFMTPLSLSDDRFGLVKRAYVECELDNAIPIEIQRAMQQALPCDPVITFDTDHSPFYSAPGQLCDALERIARG